MLHLEELCSTSLSNSFPLFFHMFPEKKKGSESELSLQEYTFFPQFFIRSDCTDNKAGCLSFHMHFMILTTQQFLNTSLLPCSATGCWWRSSVHLNSTCTSLVGFSVSTASVLAEQLLPEVNQSSPMLGVEENLSLCCTRTVFSEKWSTTSSVCFPPAAYCKSICFFFFFLRHMDIFQNITMALG